MSPKEIPPVDSERDNVEHRRLGIWDLYIAKSDSPTSLPFMHTFNEASKSLPYVIRAVRVLTLLCYKTLLLYIASALVLSLLPATKLFYSGQLLQVVQDSMESRSVEKTVLFRVLFFRISCMALSRLAYDAQSWAATRITSKMQVYYAEHILRAHVQLDVPTYDDPAVRGQLHSGVATRRNAAWTCIKTMINIISTIIQLLTQLSVLITVLKGHPDGMLLASLSFAEPVLSWILQITPWHAGGMSHNCYWHGRSADIHESVWVATCRNQDYRRLQGFKKLVSDEDYRKELVACNLQDYIITGNISFLRSQFESLRVVNLEFRTIQQRLGETGVLDYFDLQTQIDQRRDTLFALLRSTLKELPQVRMSTCTMLVVLQFRIISSLFLPFERSRPLTPFQCPWHL